MFFLITPFHFCYYADVCLSLHKVNFNTDYMKMITDNHISIYAVIFHLKELQD